MSAEGAAQFGVNWPKAKGAHTIGLPLMPYLDSVAQVLTVSSDPLQAT